MHAVIHCMIDVDIIREAGVIVIVCNGVVFDAVGCICLVVCHVINIVHTTVDDICAIGTCMTLGNPNTITLAKNIWH